MSSEAMTWAFRQHALKPPERFVLVTLADRSNQDGVCWPSRRDLSLRTGYSVRRVEQLVGALVRYGLVEKLERTGERGRQTSNMYILHFERGFDFREIGRNLKRVADYHASLPRTERDVGPGREFPVDNSEPEHEEFRPPGEKISPLGVSEISPLESNTNQQSLETLETVLKGSAVDNYNERPSLAADTVSSPTGSQEVRQGDKSSGRIALSRARQMLRAST